MVTWKDVVVEEQRREDVQQQASRRQTLRIVRADKPQAQRFYHIVLVRVGEWLETWGCRLQARYSKLDASSLGANRSLAAAGGDEAAGC